MRNVPMALRAKIALVGSVALATLPGCIIRQSEPATPTSSFVVAPPPATVQQPPTVAVQQPPPVATPAEIMTGPTLSATGAMASGSISYPSQRIHYPLSISYPRTVGVYVTGHGLDPTVAVYDPYGNRIGFNDDGGSGLDSSLVLTLAPGSYVVEIAGYGSSTGPFTLTVR